MSQKRQKLRMPLQRILCAALIVIMMALMLSACGSSKLNGTYRSSDLIAQTFIFKGDNVTMSAFGINAGGTYKIDGDEIVITYSLFGSDYTWRQPFSNSGSSIYIGGTEFVKQ